MNSTVAWNYTQSRGAAAREISNLSAAPALMDGARSYSCAAAALPVLNPVYSASLSVPVTTENRSYLRLLRARELNAWTAAQGAQETATESNSLRAAVAGLQSERKKESWLLGIVAGLAAGPVVYGLFQTWQLADQLSGFARFVRQLLS